MKSRLAILNISTLLLLLPCSGLAQRTNSDSLWLPLKTFIGRWTGKGGGQPGTGNYERTYHFVFDKRYIEVKNKSTYPPIDKNPKGEVHEDFGYFSYDKARRTFVLRQFHTEGFVNQYKLDSISSDGKKFSFVTESIENIPAGWRAKETYLIINDDQFQETFELAPPNKPFELYTSVILNRIR